MAYLTETTCIECGDGFFGDVIRELATCTKCVKLKAEKEKAAYFAKLDKMTVAERLRELEEVSYRRSKIKPAYIPSPLI